MKTPNAQANASTQFQLRLGNIAKVFNVNVSVGHFDPATLNSDATIKIDHRYGRDFKKGSSEGATSFKNEFSDNPNVDLFVRKDRDQITGILREGIWRNMAFGREVCGFKSTAISAMLRFAERDGARTAVIDYPSTFHEDIAERVAFFKMSESQREKYADQIIDGQIATVLRGVNTYLTALRAGYSDNPLEEITVALDVKAYSVWQQNLESLSKYLTFDPPEKRLPPTKDEILSISSFRLSEPESWVMHITQNDPHFDWLMRQALDAFHGNSISAANIISQLQEMSERDPQKVSPFVIKEIEKRLIDLCKRRFKEGA